MRPNAMKAKFAAGQPAFGLSVMFPSPQLVEMAAGLGFDWVLIDCEHGSIGIESVELMVMAAESAGLTPIVRPATNSSLDILRVMDRGAAGVQVPHVNTRADAERAVQAVKFHPIGRRSMAAGTRAQAYDLGPGAKGFSERSNRETLVCVQLEDAEAIANADDILKAEGVDVFFIGPSDLAQSMGHPGNNSAPEVVKAIDETLAKIVRAGRNPGMPAATEAVEKAVAKGVRYIYTHVPKLLGSAAAAYFRTARGS